VTIAEELNITKAAEKLCMSQPPLSSQMKAHRSQEVDELEPGLRHKKRPHMEASSMLDKSFCAKPDKWVWPTTIFVVTQTHLSRIAEKSLSVLCRERSSSRTRNHLII